MSCKLIRNIKHNCEYNAGGIKDIYLLDINDFITYQFLEDRLYNSCYVENIERSNTSVFIELDTIDISNFNETKENDIYIQNLTTFVRTISHEKTSALLLANSNRYLVVFRNTEDRFYCFGSDGGVTINFSQVSGQLGESSGYSVTIEKRSVFPLFEASKNVIEKPIEPEVEFFANKSSLFYEVSNNGNDIQDNLQVTSSVDNIYRDYAVVTKPEWLTAIIGDTNGKVNTLKLTIERNRTDEELRSSNLILAQSGTLETIIIPIIQKGLLEDGIPPKYPYVKEELIVDDYYEKVAQLGEQMWMAENMSYNAPNTNGQIISETQYNNIMNFSYYYWNAVNKNIITREAYNSFYNGGLMWGGYNARKIWQYIDTQNEENKHKHLVPEFADVRELMGFLIGRVWDGDGEVNDDVASLTTGQTIMKPFLNTSINTDDELRKTYPPDWDQEYLLKGTDDYALGISGSGSFHRTVEYPASGGGAKLFVCAVYLLKGVIDPNNNEVNALMYRDIGYRNNSFVFSPNGLHYEQQGTGFHCKPVRTVRYRKLKYNLYTNGSQVRKIMNTEAVPTGFQILPFDALRGAWFANNKLNYDQLTKIANYVSTVADQSRYIIG